MKKIKKAVIPAAGFGTRFLPATKSLPKEMLTIIDKPTLQFVVEEAAKSGITDILIILSRNKESIINHFDKNSELENHLLKNEKIKELEDLKSLDNLANIYYIRQKSPKGLGHAISLAEHFIGDEPFAVLLGDDVVIGDEPAIGQLIVAYEKFGTSILGVQKVPEEDVVKYGIIDGEIIEDTIHSVTSMIEKPSIEEAPTNFGVLGRYIITPKIFDILKNQKPGINDEIQLTDALHSLLEYERIHSKIFTGKRYDMGSKIGFIKATIDRALNDEEFRDETLKYLKEIKKEYNF